MLFKDWTSEINRGIRSCMAGGRRFHVLTYDEYDAIEKSIIIDALEHLAQCHMPGGTDSLFVYPLLAHVGRGKKVGNVRLRVFRTGATGREIKRPRMAPLLIYTEDHILCEMCDGID